MRSLTLWVGASGLQEIQSLLINWKGPDLTIYGELVLEGTFRLHRVRSEKTFFLFDKALLITKKRGDHFVYKGHIPVTRLPPPRLSPFLLTSFTLFIGPQSVWTQLHPSAMTLPPQPISRDGAPGQLPFLLPRPSLPPPLLPSAPP